MQEQQSKLEQEKESILNNKSMMQAVSTESHVPPNSKTFFRVVFRIDLLLVFCNVPTWQACTELDIVVIMAVEF